MLALAKICDFQGSKVSKIIKMETALNRCDGKMCERPLAHFDDDDDDDDDNMYRNGMLGLRVLCWVTASM